MVSPSLRRCALALSLLLCCAAAATEAQSTPGGNIGSEFNSNAFLRAISFSGDLQPAFKSNETSYSVILRYDDRTLTATTKLDDATGGSTYISIDGSPLEYKPEGSWTITIVNSGLTTLTIRTFAKDSTTRIDYQFLVYRPPPIASDNANLLGVTFSMGTVTPQPFSSRTLFYDLALPYLAPSATQSISVSITPAEANAYVQILVGVESPRHVPNGVTYPASVSGSMTYIKVNVISQSCRVQKLYTYYLRRPVASGGFGIVGDPVFTGLRNQVYQVHGVDGETYNILSERDMQLNAQFVFLDEGACPVVDGVVQRDCWSHPGSYLGRVGMQFRAPVNQVPKAEASKGEESELLFHRLTPTLIAAIDPALLGRESFYTETQYLLVESGVASRGFANVTLNGIQLAVGDLLSFPFPMLPALEALHNASSSDSSDGQGEGEESEHKHAFLHYASPWKLVLHVSGMAFTLRNSDRFLNHKMRFTDATRQTAYEKGQRKMHGLWGQSVTGRTYPGQKIEHIQGEVDDYVLSESEGPNDAAPTDDKIWSNNWMFNEFVSDKSLDRKERGVESTSTSSVRASSGVQIAISAEDTDLSASTPVYSRTRPARRGAEARVGAAQWEESQIKGSIGWD